jgi:ribosomal-protein-alanine N-acetyltransferase
MNIITTTNLTIQPLNLSYTAFILELTNTVGWLRFIGNRNINTIDDAHNYITKIINTPSITYYVVTLNSSNQPIGLLTVIKREYLNYPDFGFAFLPQYNTKGHAYEASKALLPKLIASHVTLAAITLADNLKSIALLQKLNFRFEKTIEIENEQLQLYTLNSLYPVLF